CHRRFPMKQVLQMIEEGTEIPDCPNCHGILKPDAVFFGETLPQETLMDATSRSRNCDLFIVIGSSLVGYPAAYMPMYAKDAGAKLAIVNLTSTPLDRYAEVLIRRKAGETMSNVVKRVRNKMSISG
ncbi:MAG: NAD-dependent protein deacylase, partial [Dehalococcoidia bacterium]